MADSSDDAYAIGKDAKVAYARKLVDRARARRSSLMRKLLIGDAIGERPDAALPPSQRRRK